MSYILFAALLVGLAVSFGIEAIKDANKDIRRLRALLDWLKQEVAE